MLSQYQGNVPTLCAVCPSWLAAGLKLTSPHTMHERDGTRDLIQEKQNAALYYFRATLK